MKKTILRAAVLACFVGFFALPANALVCHFGIADTMSFWSGGYSYSGQSPITMTQTDLTWGSFQNIAYPNLAIAWVESFAARDSTHDLLSLVYANEDDTYLSDNVSRYESDVTNGSPDGVAPVPEPCTLILLGSGLGGMLLYRRRCKVR